MKRLSLSLMAMLAATTAWASSIPLLEGTEWGPENGMGQYIQFKSGGEVFGFAGCNTFIGDYTQSRDRLSVTNLSVTEMSCDGMDGAEAAFLDGLRGSHRVDMVGTDMRFYNVDGRWILALRQRG